MPETTPDHPPMAEMPSAPRQRLRYLRILDAAAGPARKGLDAVDLPEVAERSDVPLGTVCRYFPTPTHLMLALYRHQLGELRAAAPKPSARRGGRMLTGAVMEVFHLRVMQPAVEQCLVRGVYLPELDTTALLQDTDSLAGKLIIDAGGDATTARLLSPRHHRSGPVRAEPPAVPLRGGGRPEEGLRAPGSGRRHRPHPASDGVTGLDQSGNKSSIMP